MLLPRGEQCYQTSWLAMERLESSASNQWETFTDSPSLVRKSERSAQTVPTPDRSLKMDLPASISHSQLSC
jgi:hypothetical protein